MSDQPLSEEDVFANDIDPLDAIRELRKEESVGDDEQETDVAEADDYSDTDDQDDGSSEDSDYEDDSDDDDATNKDVFDDKDSSEEGTDDDSLDDESSVSESTTDKKLTFKAHGKDFEFTEKEVMEQFGAVFGKAMDYTQKTQKLAPYMRMVSALEEESISQEDLNVAIDALKGNKGAIREILSKNSMDSFDLDEMPEGSDNHENYTPNAYGKDDFQVALEEATSPIRHDAEYPITVDVIDNQWDAASRSTFAKNPKLIQGLHNDIKSGLYDKLLPAVTKMKVLDGNTKSDIEYYILAGQQMGLQNSGNTDKVDEANKLAQDAVRNSDKASSEAERKRSASSAKSRADRKTVIDYMDDDNDEDFDKWYKKLQSNN